MQALIIPFALTLGLTSAVQLSLLPYAYLADPLPVYHQSQDTRTGQHAYSYSGGPSAKEEVKGLDGITRGSYSYVDANGHLQSVFYVADDDGFRVAATNLPTNEDLPIDPAVQLAKKLHFEQLSKARLSARKRRSLQSPEFKHKQGQKNFEERLMVQLVNNTKPGNFETVQLPVNDPLTSVLSAATSTSHQSQVQVHNSDRVEPLLADTVVEVKSEPPKSEVLIETQPSTVLLENQSPSLLLLNQVPIATSHQSRTQVHKNVQVEALKPETVAHGNEGSLTELKIPAEPDIHLPIVAAIKGTKYYVQTIPVLGQILPEDRVQVHRNLGLEGPSRKDAIKIKTTPVASVHTPLSAVPVIANDVLPVVQELPSLPSIPTSVSSQTRTQIHANTNIEISPATVFEPVVQAETIPIPSQQALYTLPKVLYSFPFAASS